MRISTGENVRLALSAVWTHRFRSLLTILGIVIGITTVVTVSSLLTGLRKGIVTFFQEFGPDNIFISKFGGDPSGRPKPSELRRKPIDPSYMEILKRLAPSAEDVSAQLFVPNQGKNPIVAKVPGFESDNVNFAACTANHLQISPRDLIAGRVFTPEEDARGAKVTIIGPSLAAVLFPDGKAAGNSVNVGGAEYIVIGVFARAKGGFFGENGMDFQALIPFQTARSRYPQIDNFFLTVKAKQGLRDQAYEEVQFVLRKVRHTPTGKENDFAISTADQIIKQFDQITGAVLMVSISISALGLLVGGIGVMNIMLVSVTERTREIGVRKAVGARSSDIVLQFLTEAVALTGVGGVIGIILATIVTMLVGALVPALPSEVPIWAVVAGFGTSVAVGVFFGVWPAVQAARLDPVDALRYE